MPNVLEASNTYSAAPTFCKCTCGKNSTIIALAPESDSQTLLARSANPSDPGLFANDALAKRTAATSCSQCTKAFCLGQSLDICKDTAEEDVVTMCFQRDSNKDKIIVWGFIVGTTGLLGYAFFKHIKRRRESHQHPGYGPVPPANR